LHAHRFKGNSTVTYRLIIRLIICLFQFVFSVGTIFFSHNKLANNIFQPAYQYSRTAPTLFLVHVCNFICQINLSHTRMWENCTTIQTIYSLRLFGSRLQLENL
jgi:hypothetical protein